VSPTGDIPQYPLDKGPDLKDNNTASNLTESNRSPQTPQAAAQDFPSGRERGGKAVIASKGRVISSGKLGKPSFR